MDGIPYQYFSYTPWGEAFKDDIVNNNSWDSPYRFNGKELDEETGLYYYGARYYNPSISVWLSVDPLAEDYPSFSSYCFTANNPIKFLDPDGRTIVNGEEEGTESYNQMQTAIDNFRHSNPEAFELLNSEEAGEIVLSFKQDLKSSNGTKLNGQTESTLEYLGEDNVEVIHVGFMDDEATPIVGYELNGNDKDPFNDQTTYSDSEAQDVLKASFLGARINVEKNLSSNEFDLSGTVAHELGHAYFGLANPFGQYKWNIIGNPNHANGSGHDLFNPSGKMADMFEKMTLFYLKNR